MHVQQAGGVGAPLGCAPDPHYHNPLLPAYLRVCWLSDNAGHCVGVTTQRKHLHTQAQTKDVDAIFPDRVGDTAATCRDSGQDWTVAWR
jgi:hypothetical protein